MSGPLEFGEVIRQPDIRYAEDMGEVILDKDWLEENKRAELYYMYRDLWKRGDEGRIKSEDLRYDITVIPSRLMGEEHVKTKGHYHPEAYQGVSYPELYEVLSGEAHYLLQKRSPSGIEDVVLIRAKSGENALMPPGYGHITVNPSEDDLKMANWTNRTFNSTYKGITELGGGAYFELLDGTFVKNDNYERVPELREVSPTELPEIGIESGNDMYDLIGDPESLDFLNNPQDYEAVFDKVL